LRGNFSVDFGPIMHSDRRVQHVTVVMSVKVKSQEWKLQEETEERRNSWCQAPHRHYSVDASPWRDRRGMCAKSVLRPVGCIAVMQALVSA